MYIKFILKISKKLNLLKIWQIFHYKFCIRKSHFQNSDPNRRQTTHPIHYQTHSLFQKDLSRLAEHFQFGREFETHKTILPFPADYYGAVFKTWRTSA